MSEDPPDARAALKQQLLADRMLGIKSVPMAPPVLSRGGYDHDASRLTDSAAAEDVQDKAERLRALMDTHVKECTKCGLSKTRTQVVFGQGNPAARLVFVGEAPGFEEDQQGLVFVGRAGRLLTKMIEAMNLTRADVFICNVLKCRPPNNRDPAANEILACRPYLLEQLQIIEPQVLIALGAPAAKTLLNTTQGIGKLRGRFHDYYPSGTSGVGPSVPLMPTYHPAYLLRSPGEKGKAWADLQMVMALLGLERPGKG